MRVAEQRAELGMTRNDLAARIGTLPTTIASIEEGYLPRAKIRNQLAVALNGEPSGRVRRKPSGPSPVGQRRRPRVPVGTGWFSVGLPLSILIAGGLGVGAILVGGQLSGGDGAPPAPRLVAVSSVLGPPASIHRAGVQAQKAAAAEARRAAEIRRERAAAASAAAAARKAAAKEADRSAPTQTQPVTQPVAPSPAPSGGGGQGGSSGAGDAPSLQHGIGGGG